MGDRFTPGRRNDWVTFCDICGKKCYASEVTKLSNYTGRGGLFVCRQDADKIDAGLIPFRIPVEQNVPFMRSGDTDTTDGTAIVDPESMTYQYYLASSQDNAIIIASQDDAWIISETAV